MYSFFPHIINLWNKLPYSVVHSESLVRFKHSLQLDHRFNIVDVCYFMHPLLLCIDFIKKRRGGASNVCFHSLNNPPKLMGILTWVAWPNIGCAAVEPAGPVPTPLI